MLQGDNGIIAKASEAKLESRAGNVDEEVKMWRNNNEMIKKQNNITGENKPQVSKEEMLTKLLQDGIVYEKEIDRQKEIIKIGTREISYGIQVIINVSKTPGTETTGAVYLEVTSVERIETQTRQVSQDEYAQLMADRISSMTDGEREDLVVKIEEIFGFTGDFNDLVNSLYELNIIKANTKEAYYEYIDEEHGGICNYLLGECIDYDYELIGRYDKDTGTLEMSYKIVNPEGLNENCYIAKENGDYTFNVKEDRTGNQYQKTINVSNIVESEQLNYSVGNYKDTSINLIDKDANLPTTFQKIYIIQNGSTVDISNLIRNQEEYNSVEGWDIHKEIGVERGTYEFIIQKDNIFYMGPAYVEYVG